MSLKSPLGRVLGLGSAKEGTEHWWHQRVTAVAMVPLTLWLFVALITLPDYGFETVQGFIATPFNAIALLLLTGTLLFHSALGTQVVIEDYLRGSSKLITLLLTRFAYIALAVAAVFAILKISLGS